MKFYNLYFHAEHVHLEANRFAYQLCSGIVDYLSERDPRPHYVAGELAFGSRTRRFDLNAVQAEWKKNTPVNKIIEDSKAELFFCARIYMLRQTLLRYKADELLYVITKNGTSIPSEIKHIHSYRPILIPNKTIKLLLRVA